MRSNTHETLRAPHNATADIPVAFYTRHGHAVVPAENAFIMPRRGIFAFAVANGLALLVEQKIAHGFFELPGGGIEDGETPDEAVAREWAEETGLPFNVGAPRGEFRHTRGYYAEDLNEFWVYDQTFRLYDYAGAAREGHAWQNPENDTAIWKPLAELASLPINRAHWSGISALITAKVV